MRMEAGLDTGPDARGTRRRHRAGRHRRHAARSPRSCSALAVARDARCAGAGTGARDAAAEAGVTYAQKISKAEAGIDWQARCRRGAAQGPGVQSGPGRADPLGHAAAAHLGGGARAAAAAETAAPGMVTGAAPHGIDVACGSGALRITRLQLAGRKPADRGRIPEFRAARGRKVLEPMSGASVGARALAAQATTRVLSERVTLDAALEGVLAEAPRALVPPVRSLSFGAVRGFYRHEAILQRVLAQPAKSLDCSFARSCRWRCSSSRMRARPTMRWSMRR